MNSKEKKTIQYLVTGFFLGTAFRWYIARINSTCTHSVISVQNEGHA